MLDSSNQTNLICFLFLQGETFSMYILLPNQVNGLNGLLYKLDNSSISIAQKMLEKVEVAVSIPKFSFKNDIDLNEVLQKVKKNRNSAMHC